MPYSMIEPVREMLDAGFSRDLDDQDERWVNALRQTCMDVDVPPAPRRPPPVAPARHPAHAAGDVIPVEMPEETIMRANGVPAFKVKMGSHSATSRCR
jgi:flagellar motor switch protein FliM